MYNIDNEVAQYEQRDHDLKRELAETCALVRVYDRELKIPDPGFFSITTEGYHQLVNDPEHRYFGGYFRSFHTVVHGTADGSIIDQDFVEETLTRTIYDNKPDAAVKFVYLPVGYELLRSRWLDRPAFACITVHGVYFDESGNKLGQL